MYFTMNEMTLSENDFRFSQIRIFHKSADPLPNQLVITPVKSNTSFGALSPAVHKCYIKHGIEQIKNDAPTLEQWWEELKVYRPELIDDGRPWIERDPEPEFFKRANAMFATSQLSRRRKADIKEGLKPVYFYHVNEETGEVEHLDLRSARRLYCKKYEETTLCPKSKSLKIFQYLLTLCKNRDDTIPILIKCHNVSDALDGPTNIKKRYEDMSKPFGHGYCLAEMLIHYPNLEECVWNKEDQKGDDE